jgi:CheY-like chemotaxis protein
MPIMTGYESTRHIRSVELERQLAYDHQNLIQSPYLSSVSATDNSNSFPFHTPPSNHHPSHYFTTCSTSTSKTSSAANSPSAFFPPNIDLHLRAPKLKLNTPSLIIALTGFSSQKDQEMAFEAGVDIFMTKPVRFREVGRILEGWMKSRESEQRGGGRENGALDEAASGAKRSG